MPILIRKGTKADLPYTLDLVKELARYENAPAEVTVTVADMEKDGFGNPPAFEFFAAEAEERIVGIALYYTKYSTWKGKCIFLEDIIVTETHRKQGIGKLLFNAVVNVAKETESQRLEWQVLEWNEPAIKFYQKLNANFDSEWINCKLTKEQIEQF